MGSGPTAKHSVERLNNALTRGQGNIASHCPQEGSIGALLLTPSPEARKGRLVVSGSDVLLEVLGEAVARLRSSSKTEQLRACLEAGFPYAGQLRVKGNSVRVEFRTT